MTDKGVKELASAIVRLACKDYVRWRGTKKGIKLREFFTGEWFLLLSDLDGEAVLDALDRATGRSCVVRKK